MDTLDVVRIVLGTAIIVVCAALAARRWSAELKKLQDDPGTTEPRP